MLRLIINADDFGMTKEINEGVRRAHLEGILTSASLMANGAAFDQAAAISLELKSLDVGVHLAMADGIPLLSPEKVKTLLNSRNHFHSNNFEFACRYYIKKIDVNEIYAEFRAQIEKVKTAGISISHIDGHKHMHMFPKVLDEVIRLAKEFDIPFIRLPYERFDWNLVFKSKNPWRVVELAAINSFSLWEKDKIKRRPHHFAGFLLGGRLNKVNLKEVIIRLPKEGTCELMCHPALSDEDGYARADELAALCDAGIKQLIEQRNIKLISFQDLVLENAGVQVI